MASLDHQRTQLSALKNSYGPQTDFRPLDIRGRGIDWMDSCLHCKRRIYTGLVSMVIGSKRPILIRLAAGICLESAGNLEEAVQTYESMLPYISKAHSSFGNTPEHRRWTQGLISRHCLLSSRYVKSKARHPHELLSSSSFIRPISVSTISLFG